MSLDLDALLDGTLDDLADLPEFKPFPAGTHRVSATIAPKDIGGRFAFELTCTMIEPLELADPTEEPPKVGDTASSAYLMDNEFGQGAFKKIAAVFVSALQLENSKRAIVEGVKDIECVIVSTIRVDKKDPDKKYFAVKELQVI